MTSKETGCDSNDRNQPHATISDLYPDVGRIILFVAFEEADAESEPNYQQIIFTAETEAVFRLDCSRDACVGGGFDFAPAVAEMVSTKESRVQGTLACAGTLGAGGHGCGLKAEYRIIAD
ncbi:MAG TPA: hypothetical protein VI298_01240 [Geobacteraceae bacterium]